MFGDGHADDLPLGGHGVHVDLLGLGDVLADHDRVLLGQTDGRRLVQVSLEILKEKQKKIVKPF